MFLIDFSGTDQLISAKSFTSEKQKIYIKLKSLPAFKCLNWEAFEGTFKPENFESAESINYWTSQIYLSDVDWFKFSRSTHL